MSILSKIKTDRLVSKNEHVKNVKAELKNRVSGYVVGAFGLVAALAWNDAISSFIKIIFPESSSSLVAKFIYALIMTAVVAIIAIYVTKILAEKEK